MVPALEYLVGTAPREPHGLSAFDLSQGYGLLIDPNRRLGPFQLPWGLAETDVAQQLFARFKDLYGIFARATAEEVLKRQEELHRKRTVRIFDAGAIARRPLLRSVYCGGSALVSKRRPSGPNGRRTTLMPAASCATYSATTLLSI